MQKTASQIADEVLYKLAVPSDDGAWAPVLGNLALGGPVGAAIGGGMVAPKGYGSSAALGSGAGAALGGLVGLTPGVVLGLAARSPELAAILGVGGGALGSSIGAGMGYNAAVGSGKHAADELSDVQRHNRLMTGALGMLPGIGIAGPIYAGVTAPEGYGGSRALGSLGWGMAGSLPGAALMFGGALSRNPRLYGTGLGAGLVGQGLGAAYGAHRSMLEENADR